jgi:hypothetical protein
MTSLFLETNCQSCCAYHSQYIGDLAVGSIDADGQDPLEGITHLLDGQVSIEKNVKRESSTEELR